MLGLQTINVAHRNIILAMATSLCLGMCGFITVSKISEVKKPFTRFWYTYIVAGPCGIATSILIQPYLELGFAS